MQAQIPHPVLKAFKCFSHIFFFFHNIDSLQKREKEDFTFHYKQIRQIKPDVDTFYRQKPSTLMIKTYVSLSLLLFLGYLSNTNENPQSNFFFCILNLKNWNSFSFFVFRIISCKLINRFGCSGKEMEVPFHFYIQIMVFYSLIKHHLTVKHMWIHMYELFVRLGAKFILEFASCVCLFFYYFDQLKVIQKKKFYSPKL